MTPTTLADTLAVQLRYTHWVVTQTMGGITHEQALIAPPEGGNCMNWVLGHIASSRNGMLKMLGVEPAMDAAADERYRRGSTAVTADDAVPTDDLLAAFDKAQAGLLEGLRNLPEERLGDPAPFSPGNDPDETVGSLLAGLLFHESYHVGQLGVLRRSVGCEPIIR